MGLSLDFSFFFFSIFFFLWTLGHFWNIEHDSALLHMSTYIAERWHRAHGLCMCWGGEAPFVRNYTHTLILTISLRMECYTEMEIRTSESNKDFQNLPVKQGSQSDMMTLGRSCSWKT